MRAFALLAGLALACGGSRASATGMYVGGPIAAESAVLATGQVSDAARAGESELLPSVAFQPAATFAGWSAGGDPTLSAEGALAAGSARSAGDAATGAHPPPACSDGLDDDGDGYVDFPDDPGCLTPGSVTEQPRCQDGIDTDGDGAVDFDGGASLNGGVPIAPPDPECEGAPWRYVERP